MKAAHQEQRNEITAAAGWDRPRNVRNIRCGCGKTSQGLTTPNTNETSWKSIPAKGVRLVTLQRCQLLPAAHPSLTSQVPPMRGCTRSALKSHSNTLAISFWQKGAKSCPPCCLHIRRA